MLSKEGYASLYKVWLFAAAAINERMDQTIKAQRARTDQRPAWTSHRSNVDIAARFLAYDVIVSAVSEGRGSISIMRPDGGLISISPLLLEPADTMNRSSDYYKGWAAARKSGLIPRGERVFSTKALRQDFWQLPFLEQEVFEQRKLSRQSYRVDIYDEISVIDWHLGTIDLTLMRTFLKGFAQLREAYFTLRPLGYEFPHHYALMFEDENDGVMQAHPSKTLNMLSPYDGCTIVVPKEFMVAFDEFPSGEQQKDINLPPQISAPPKDAILRLLDEQPQFSKAEVRKELFPNISHRKFESYWARAAEERSDLSKPGRKTAKS